MRCRLRGDRAKHDRKRLVNALDLGHSKPPDVGLPISELKAEGDPRGDVRHLHLGVMFIVIRG